MGAVLEVEVEVAERLIAGPCRADPVACDVVVSLGKLPAGDQVGDSGKVLSDIQRQVAVAGIAGHKLAFVELQVLVGRAALHHGAKPAITDGQGSFPLHRRPGLP